MMRRADAAAMAKASSKEKKRRCGLSRLPDRDIPGSLKQKPIMGQAPLHSVVGMDICVAHAGGVL